MILVVDASVALKWFFQTRDDEPDSDLALAILAGVVEDRIQLLQPPHFISEVAAVLAREKPEQAPDDIADLLRIECAFADTLDTYATAIDLSIRCRHHLFDTLYHAVALSTPGAMLLTADRRYYDKACGLGRIVWLADFRLPS